MSLLTAGPAQGAARHAAAPVADPTTTRGRRRTDLRLVEAPARRRVRVGFVSTIVLATIFAGLFSLAAMHSLVVQAQFELDRLDEQVATREDQIDARRVEVAELESPSAIVEAANELGMVDPIDTVYLATPESGLVPGEPRAVTGPTVDGEQAGRGPAAP